MTLSFTARVRSGLPDGAVFGNQAFLSGGTQAGIPTDDPLAPALDEPTLAAVREPVASLLKRILGRNGSPLPDDPFNPPGVSGAISAVAGPGDILTYGHFFANDGSGAAVAFVARDGRRRSPPSSRMP